MTSSVVITGSTRGIGLGLAEAFLTSGAQVMVSGRTEQGVAKTLQTLVARFPSARVSGQACDVTVAEQVQTLWDAAVAAFGSVEHFVNNAGTCNAIRPFVELSPAEVGAVVDSNLKGGLNGSLVALRGMQRQGHGTLYNMEGWGSRNEWSPGMTPYCTSKRALRYLSDSLAKELVGSNIRACTLSPGMVLTDLLVSSYERGVPANWQRRKWLFRFVVDPQEVVCSWLVERMLRRPSNGAHITWMTPTRLLARFFQPSYYRRNPFAGTALDTLGD